MIVGICVFAITALGVAVVRRYLKNAGVVDIPNHRSSHSVPVIRGGGIAPAVVIIAGLAIAAVLLSDYALPILAVAFGAAGSALLGWFEDKRGVSVKKRLLIQMIIGLCTSAFFAALYGATLLWLPILVFFYVSYVNIANFMDGINGISALHGAVAGGAYMYLGFSYEQPWLAIAGLLLGAAFLGFLPLNALGKIFLGDVGSYLLGGVVATIAIGSFLAGIPLLKIVAPLLVYLVDTSWTLLQRAKRGEKLTEAHRSHVYQQLTPQFIGHLQTSIFVAVTSVVLVFISHVTGQMPAIITIFLFAAVSVMYVYAPKFAAKLTGLRVSNG